MKKDNAVYVLKFVLSFNPYFIIFFPFLLSNGFSGVEILTAVSIGTWTMILGNFLSSFVVDYFGPKRPMLIFSLLQGIVLIFLLFVDDFLGLIIFEVGVGLSFPAIYGADSKWLKFLHRSEPNNKISTEKRNQMFLWIAQIASVAFGVLFLEIPSILIGINALVYFFAIPLILILPDITSRSDSKPKLGLENNGIVLGDRTQIKSVSVFLLLSLGFGFLASFTWLFQYLLSDLSQNEIFLFALLQLLGATLSLLGNSLPPSFRRGVFVLAIFLILVVGVSYSLTYNNSLFLLVCSFVALLARGAVNLKLREHIALELASEKKMASVIALSGGISKIFSSAIIYFWTLVPLSN